MAAELQKDTNLQLTVVAPDSQRSAAGHSMSLYHPVKVFEHNDGWYATDGTPADCVKAALGMFPDLHFDLVVSGINQGPNLGMDTYYSGTVAAAREAAFYGIPALATSLAVFDFIGGKSGFHEAAAVTAAVVKVMLEMELPEGTLYNLNVPVSQGQAVKTIQQTRLGGRIFQEKLEKRVTPFGQPYFWLACMRVCEQAAVGSDLEAIRSGAASLTPLRLDTTAQNSVREQLGQVLERVQL